MPTLAEIRAKYPQYQDMPDAAFADAFYKKFYADIPRPEFDTKLGIKPQAPDTFTTGNILPWAVNDRTGEGQFAIPEALKGITDLATGKIDPQAMDPSTGEFHTNPQAIGPAMDTAMTVAGAPPGAAGAAKVGSAVAKAIPERMPKPLPKPAIIPASQWEMAKGAAYKAVDDSGVKYSQGGFNRLVDNIDALAKSKDINPLRHPKANSVIEEMKAAKGSSPTLTQLDQWRQVVRRDVQGDEAEGFFRDQIIGAIDGFISNATTKDVVAGSDPKQAAELVLKARKANATFRKTETLEDVLQKASNQAKRAGSGGNVDNAIRQQIDAILRNKKKSRFFSPTERAAMQKVVDGDSIQNFARLVGKMSPEGNGLMAMLQTLGGVFSGGVTVPLAIGGFAAKRFADKATRSNLDDVTRLIQSGGQ